MKKNIFGKKFKRDKNERRALFRGLMSSLILKERIQTSEAKAKAIKPEIERLVTKAKKMSNSSFKTISSDIYPNAVEKFVSDVAPRFKDINGGYTRIIKLGKRLGDRSQVVMLEWTEAAKAVEVVPPKKIQEKPSTKALRSAKKTVKKASSQSKVKPKKVVRKVK